MHEDKQRGECMILVHGAEVIAADQLEAERILKILLDVMPVKQAAQVASEITGLRKNELYDWAVQLKEMKR